MSSKGYDDEDGPLLRAQKVGEEAAKRGFDWDDHVGPLAKIYEELGELEEEITATIAEPSRLSDEVGDLLFSVVNLARHLNVDASAALAGTVEKFDRRLQRVYELAEAGGDSAEGLSLPELERLWQQAKRELG